MFNPLPPVKKIALLPFTVMGLLGFGFLVSLSIYNFDLSLALDTIGIEGLFLLSLVISAILEILFVIIITTFNFIFQLDFQSDVIFVLSVSLGVGILLLWYNIPFVHDLIRIGGGIIAILYVVISFFTKYYFET